jgi:hypothetical protein
MRKANAVSDDGSHTEQGQIPICLAHCEIINIFQIIFSVKQGYNPVPSHKEIHENKTKYYPTVYTS